LSNLSPLASIYTANPFKIRRFLIFSANYAWSFPIGINLSCLGDNQKSHFPPVCSHKMAMNLYKEPKIAL
jgi:hypothetical protein